MSVWEGVAITVLAVWSIQPVLGAYNEKKIIPLNKNFLQVVIAISFQDLKQNRKNYMIIYLLLTYSTTYRYILSVALKLIFFILQIDLIF